MEEAFMGDSIKHRLLEDFAELIEDVESLLAEGADATTDSLRDAQKSARSRLSDAKERLADLEKDVVGDVKRRIDRTDRYMHDNPWGALGATAAVAFLLGYMAHRRDE
jgi:ElaB/YqjD/DUF883 family membrane-anchored ribosome-binding protein